jgi:ATP-dependent Clp protease ATP-binding subunit ClpC
MIDRLREQLMLQGIGISLSDEARTLLAEHGFDPTMGARPLRRAIQRMVEDPLSEQILAGQWQPGQVVEVRVEDGAISFTAGEGAVAVPVSRGASEKKSPSMPRRGKGRSGGTTVGGATSGE